MADGGRTEAQKTQKGEANFGGRLGLLVISALAETLNASARGAARALASYALTLLPRAEGRDHAIC